MDAALIGDHIWCFLVTREMNIKNVLGLFFLYSLKFYEHEKSVKNKYSRFSNSRLQKLGNVNIVLTANLNGEHKDYIRNADIAYVAMLCLQGIWEQYTSRIALWNTFGTKKSRPLLSQH